MALMDTWIIFFWPSESPDHASSRVPRFTPPPLLQPDLQVTRSPINFAPVPYTPPGATTTAAPVPTTTAMRSYPFPTFDQRGKTPIHALRSQEAFQTPAHFQTNPALSHPSPLPRHSPAHTHPNTTASATASRADMAIPTTGTPATTSCSRLSDSALMTPRQRRKAARVAATQRPVSGTCAWMESDGTVCGAELHGQDIAERHVGEHIETGVHRCHWRGCEKETTFRSRTQVLLHVLTAHFHMRPFVCDDCGDSFTLASVLRRHQMIHSGAKPLTCPVPGCTRCFRHHNSVAAHLRTHSPSETRDLVRRSRARRRGTLSSSRPRHESSSSSSNEGSSGTPVSLMSLSPSSSYHSLQETQQPLSSCPICGDEFRCAADLHAHELAEHGDEM